MDSRTMDPCNSLETIKQRQLKQYRIVDNTLFNHNYKKEKAMKQLFVTTLLLLTSIAIKAQSDPEQEVFFSLINQVVTTEEKFVNYIKKGQEKGLEKIPKKDSANIQRFLENYKSTSSYAVLIKETTMPSSLKNPSYESMISMVGYLKDKLLSFDSVMFVNMIRSSEKSITIDSFEVFINKVTYLTNKELDLVFEDGEWENYYKKYKNQPIIRCSRPGFNERKDRAMIYYSKTRGSRAGVGYIIILEKVDGKWIQKDSCNIWVS